VQGVVLLYPTFYYNFSSSFLAKEGRDESNRPRDRSLFRFFVSKVLEQRRPEVHTRGARHSNSGTHINRRTRQAIKREPLVPQVVACACQNQTADLLKHWQYASSHRSRAARAASQSEHVLTLNLPDPGPGPWGGRPAPHLQPERGRLTRQSLSVNKSYSPGASSESLRSAELVSQCLCTTSRRTELKDHQRFK
jgi:hypothetical protein